MPSAAAKRSQKITPKLTPKPPQIMLKADNISITATADNDGHIRVIANSWDDARVLLVGERLVISQVDGQINLVRHYRSPPGDLVQGWAAEKFTEIKLRASVLKDVGNRVSYSGRGTSAGKPSYYEEWTDSFAPKNWLEMSWVRGRIHMIERSR
jgi:hypothetical protein